MTLYQSSFIGSHCGCDRGQQVLTLLCFVCDPPNFAFSVSHGMIEYKRDSEIDRYEVLLRIFILACNRAALFTDMRPHDVFTDGNLIPRGIFNAFGDI